MVFPPSTGMEFLAPKTGFFCKVCNRFFSGAKEAEMAHCKTQKHYDNVKVSTHQECWEPNSGLIVMSVSCLKHIHV